MNERNVSLLIFTSRSKADIAKKVIKERTWQKQGR